MDILKTSSFQQKIIERFPFDGRILSAAVSSGTLYVCADTGFYRFGPDGALLISDEMHFDSILSAPDGSLLASAGAVLYRVDGDVAEQLGVFPADIDAFTADDKIYVVADSSVFVGTPDGFIKLCGTEQPAFAIAARGGRVCMANSRCIQRLEGKRQSWRCIFPEHSTMPDIVIRSIAFDANGYLLVGADEGLFIYDYMSGWCSHRQISALPEDSVNDIAVCPDGSFLLGTSAGAVHIKHGAAKYLPAERYAFSPDVTRVAADSEALYTVSDGGVVRITERETTLEQKARHMFLETEKYFPRKDGYVTAIYGHKGSGCSAVTDNDGLWTQTYISALSMCYSLTGDKDVLAAARRSMNAMLLLTRAPGIKGFTARAVRYPDEKNWGVGLDTQGIGDEWRRSPDGKFEWLGETSSDEMSGHFLGFCLYYDLCADENEKSEIRKAVCDITDHILEHDGYLFDIDGKPTTWACWNENALNYDSMWMWEKGVNSLEMLNFLKVAYHMSGDEKYNEKYRKLIRKDHFLLNAAYHKRDDGHSCHIDDNLAMLNTFSLLRLEQEPAIREYILMGLSSHYDYERIERNPYYSYVYKAFTGRGCDVDTVTQALRDHPYELESCRMINSVRRGLKMDDSPLKWGERPRIASPLPWDERPFDRLGINPFGIDSPDRVRTESGVSYLFTYWLGRFLGIIE